MSRCDRAEACTQRAARTAVSCALRPTPTSQGPNEIREFPRRAAQVPLPRGARGADGRRRTCRGSRPAGMPAYRTAVPRRRCRVKYGRPRRNLRRVSLHDPLAQAFRRDVEHDPLDPLDQELRDGRREVEDDVKAHPRLVVAFPREVVLTMLAALVEGVT